MSSYAVRLTTRYDGMVVATFPDLPGVIALGRDDEEAHDEARRALADAIAEFARDGVEPPAPSTPGLARISVELTARPAIPA